MDTALQFRNARRCALALGVPLLMTMIAGCGHESQSDTPAAPATVAVTVAPVVALTVPSQVEIAGTVRPIDRAMMAARVMGQVTSLPVTLGQIVAPGDVLVVLDAPEWGARLRGAEATLAQVQRDLAREEKLLAQGASPEEQVLALRDRERQLGAAVDEARTMLDYTRIVAPFAGVVTERPAQIGTMANPGQPLLTLERLAPLRVEVGLPEKFAGQLAVGEAISVRVREHEIVGTLSEISGAADPTNRTVGAKIDLPPDAPAHSGEYARVVLRSKTGSARPQLFVPTSSVVHNGQMAQVFVVAADHAVLRLVKTAARSAQGIEILAGLQAGQMVVVNPSPSLRDGQPVSVQP